MEQYLKWEKEKLIQQYKSAKEELVKCRQGLNRKDKPVF